MTRLTGIELLKLRTIRLPSGLLITAAVLTALFASLEAARAGHGSSAVAPLNTVAGLGAVTTLTGISILLAAILGAIVVDGEFRHHTITLTYLETPARARVMAAKAAAAFLVGAIFGLVAGVIATGVGLAFAAGHGDHISLSAGTMAGHLGGAVLGAALLAAVGVSIGSLIRSQLATVIGILVWGIMLESIIGGLFTTIRPYLPYTAATTMAGVPLGDAANFGAFRVHIQQGAIGAPLPFAAAAGLLAGYAVLICVIAALTTVPRDIS